MFFISFGPGGFKKDNTISYHNLLQSLQNGSIDAYHESFPNYVLVCLYWLFLRILFLILLIPPYYLFVYICFNSGWYLWEKLKELTRWIVGKLGFHVIL
jgi:hypothetical protein